MNKIKIKKISYLNTLPIRSAVLRQGKPIETCFFFGDDNINTVHFGLFINYNLIGVASLFKIDNINFNKKNQFQLRGMAILNEFQGLSFGNLILKEICNYAKLKKADVLWFNAREKAVEFYQKSGFSIHGNSFVITEIGNHNLMYMYFID